MTADYYDGTAVIETERLLLRPLEKSDARAIFLNISHDRDVLRYYLAPYIEKEEDASLDSSVDAWAAHKIYCFAVVLKESGEVIGMMNQCSTPNSYFPNMELGCALGKKYWNCGYATEALRAVMDFLFEKGIHKITCCHLSENTASGKVLQKAGMILEGVRTSEIFYHDRYWDTVNYYVLNPAEKQQ